MGMKTQKASCCPLGGQLKCSLSDSEQDQEVVESENKQGQEPNHPVNGFPKTEWNLTANVFPVSKWE